MSNLNKILITGVNGFLGSHIKKKFENNKFNVKSISYRDDISKETENKILEFSPDIIIHCAWNGGNNYSDASSSDQFYKNIPNSIKLLNVLKIINKKTLFVGFGTAFEYGNTNKISKESDIELPVDLYGASKLLLKNISQNICLDQFINWLWIRPFYVYGPGDIESRLIPRVINSIKDYNDLVFDECNSIIDYVYIDDFVNALYTLIIGKYFGVYNICSNNQYDIRSIILKISELMNNPKEIIFDATLNKNKPSFICGNNKKLIDEAFWEPKVSLEEGLKKTIEYYVKQEN